MSEEKRAPIITNGTLSVGINSRGVVLILEPDDKSERVLMVPLGTMALDIASSIQKAEMEWLREVVAELINQDREEPKVGMTSNDDEVMN